MAGKRIKDPSLVATDFSTARAAGAELLVDWEPLVEARTLELGLVGNAYIQGSSSGVTWSDQVLPTHDYIRVSTDGGTSWLPIPIGDLTALTADSHPALTLGTANGLSLDVPNQVLSLATATPSTPGALSAADKIKVDTLIIDNTGEKFYADDGTYKTLLGDAYITITHDAVNDEMEWTFDASQLSVLTEEGIQGGGTLDVTRTLKLDIDGLDALGSPDHAADYVAVYDDDAGVHKKVLLEDIGNVYTASNLGSGNGIFAATVAGDHQFKSLKSSDASVTFTVTGTEIDLSATGAGGGETNTYSNSSVGGIGIILTKNGVDFPFKGIADAGSSRVTVANDAVNYNVTLDVNESNLTIANMSDAATHGVDHSAVSLLAGTAISSTGLGDLTADRTINVDISGLSTEASPATSDYIMIYDGANHEKAQIDTLPFIATSRTINTQEGITGGGDLSADRTLELDIDNLTTITTVDVGADYLLIWDDTDSTHKNIFVDDLVKWGNISGTLADQTDLQAALDLKANLITITAGVALTGGGDLSANRTINFDIEDVSASAPDYDDLLIWKDPTGGTHHKTTIANLPFTCSNIGDVDIFKQKTNATFELRGLTSGSSAIGVALNGDNIEISLDETLIDHDLLFNFVTNEHIDHSAVSIVTGEGLTGGGDLTTSRTLDLDISGISTTTSATGDYYTLVYDSVGGQVISKFSDIDLLTVEEEDGSPSVTKVNTIKFTNGSVTNEGGGVVSVTVPTGLWTDAGTYIYRDDKVVIGTTSSSSEELYVYRPNESDAVAKFENGIAGNGIIIQAGSTSSQKPLQILDGSGTERAYIDAEGILALKETTTPSLDSGFGLVYPKSDGYLYFLNDSGVEYNLTEAGSGGTPAGSDKQVQFNDGGSFGASSEINIYNDKLGIGTSSPLYPLDVFRDSTSWTARIRNGNSSGNGLYISAGTDSSDYPFYITDDNANEIFSVRGSGDLYAPGLTQSSYGNMLYYDSSTGRITYDSTGGGGTYLGWDLYVDGSNKGVISSGENVNIVGGTDITLNYSSVNNTIEINSTASGGGSSYVWYAQDGAGGSESVTDEEIITWTGAGGINVTLNETTNTFTIDGSGIGGGGVTSPLTTKGDIWVYGLVDLTLQNTRMPAGSNGTVLGADSTKTTGLAYLTHDEISGFVADEHIPHSTINVTGRYSVRNVNGISPSIDTNVQLELVGDAASPGNSYYYGTNASGTKGWYTLSSSAFNLTVKESDGSPTLTGIETITFSGATVSAGTGSEAIVTVTGGGSSGITISADGSSGGPFTGIDFLSSKITSTRQSTGTAGADNDILISRSDNDITVTNLHQGQVRSLNTSGNISNYSYLADDYFTRTNSGYSDYVVKPKILTTITDGSPYPVDSDAIYDEFLTKHPINGEYDEEMKASVFKVGAASKWEFKVSNGTESFNGGTVPSNALIFMYNNTVVAIMETDGTMTGNDFIAT